MSKPKIRITLPDRVGKQGMLPWSQGWGMPLTTRQRVEDTAPWRSHIDIPRYGGTLPTSGKADICSCCPDAEKNS